MIPVSFLQLAKAVLAVVSTLSRIVISARLVHPMHEPTPIFFSPFGRAALARLEQPEIAVLVVYNS